MRLNLPKEIDKIQWLRRLGVTEEADDDLRGLIEKAERKLLDAASPQGTYRVLETDGLQPGGCADMAEAFGLPGSAIKKHLAECKSMIVMAVTLGSGIDRIIRTSQIRDMAEAVVMDAGASVLVEQAADEMEERIHAEISSFIKNSENDAVYLTGRYSPGYGDFPIEMQARLLKMLDAPKRIGLSVNESYIMTPRKSISAIIGLADHPVTGYKAACDECLIKESCGLRKEGKKCWT